MDGEDAEGPAKARTGDRSRRIAGEIYEASVRARVILDAAEARGRSLLRAAEAERQGWRAVAEEAGRREGLARAAGEVARGVRERDRLIAACTAEVLDVAAAIATRILGREVRVGFDAVNAAGRALAELRGARRATLRACPDDVVGIRAAAGPLAEAVGRLHVVEDASLSPGEVMVEADGARVDGRFPAQLAELRRALLEIET